MKISELHQHFLNSSGVCTDSRKIKENCLFFALKGDNFNGNEYAHQALDKGAYKAVIDQIAFHKNTGETILHGNALKMMQELATYHRNYLEIPVISLTGSNGKTTTKELINAVLSKKFRTTATQGNLNNHIGVPLTLLSMTNETELGIVEMGANHQKEIELLSNIAMPDFGYITNFGKAHLEGFGGVEGVIKGKSELYIYLKDHNKKVFVNGNDPKQVELTRSMNRYTFGNEEQDCEVKLVNDHEHVVVAYNGLTIKTNLVGLYNFHNIAAAIAMGHYFEVPAEQIKTAIEAYIPENNRSQQLSKGKFSIILDAYNANPTSMTAAIASFRKQKGEPKIYVLGDMFELGEDAPSEHQGITALLQDDTDARVILVGENFFGTLPNGTHFQKFDSFEALATSWKDLNINEGSMLIKGSRGMALERVIELLD